MRSTYDDEADALYVCLKEGVAVDRSIVVDGERVVDVDRSGEPIGIEVIGASEGVALTDLIERFGLDRFRSHLERLEASRFSALGPAGGTS